MGLPVLNPRLIELELNAHVWRDAVVTLSRLLWREKRIRSMEGFVRDVCTRERVMSTFCGRMIAIPHAVSSTVITPSLSIGRTRGLIWHTPDEWVRLVFVLAIPEPTREGQRHAHQVDILSAIAASALEEVNIQGWLQAESAEEIVQSLSVVLPAIEKPIPKIRRCL